MATASADALSFAETMAQGDTVMTAGLASSAQEVMSNDQYRGQLGNSKPIVSRLANMGSSGGSNKPAAPWGPGPGGPRPQGPGGPPPTGPTSPLGGNP